MTPIRPGRPVGEPTCRDSARGPDVTCDGYVPEPTCVGADLFEELGDTRPTYGRPEPEIEPGEPTCRGSVLPEVEDACVPPPDLLRDMQRATKPED